MTDTGDRKDAYRVLVRKPKEEGPLKHVDNIKMHLKEIGWEGVD